MTPEQHNDISIKLAVFFLFVILIICAVTLAGFTDRNRRHLESIDRYHEINAVKDGKYEVEIKDGELMFIYKEQENE